MDPDPDPDPKHWLKVKRNKKVHENIQKIWIVARI